MQELGYEIKKGKHIAFRLVGQEWFTMSKTIGADYTEERINDRFKSVSNHFNKSSYTSLSNKRIVDINTHKLVLESEGFARWLKLQNLKTISLSWNEFTNNGIRDLPSFCNKIDSLHDELSKIQNKIKIVESDMKILTDKIENIKTYKNYRNIYECYQISKNIDAYFHMYEKEIILFEAAREALGTPISNELLLSVLESEKLISSLTTKSKILNDSHFKIKNNIIKTNQLKRNLTTYLDSTYYYECQR